MVKKHVKIYLTLLPVREKQIKKQHRVIQCILVRNKKQQHLMLVRMQRNQ